MKSNKSSVYIFLLYLIIILLFIGGITGILRKTVAGLENLSLNSMLNLQGQDPDIPFVFVYSITLAVLEITSAFLLIYGLKRKKIFCLYFGVAVISISAAGCIIAILLGDLFAVFSLITRLVVLILLLSQSMKSLFSEKE